METLRTLQIDSYGLYSCNHTCALISSVSQEVVVLSCVFVIDRTKMSYVCGVFVTSNCSDYERTKLLLRVIIKGERAKDVA